MPVTALAPSAATTASGGIEASIGEKLRIATAASQPTNNPMLPPMPQPSYQHLTDEDLKAIFAYLKSVPPIKNQVPEWVPPAGGAPGPAAGTH